MFQSNQRTTPLMVSEAWGVLKVICCQPGAGQTLPCRTSDVGLLTQGFCACSWQERQERSTSGCSSSSAWWAWVTPVVGNRKEKGSLLTGKKTLWLQSVTRATWEYRETRLLWMICLFILGLDDSKDRSVVLSFPRKSSTSSNCAVSMTVQLLWWGNEEVYEASALMKTMQGHLQQKGAQKVSGYFSCWGPVLLKCRLGAASSKRPEDRIQAVLLGQKLNCIHRIAW